VQEDDSERIAHVFERLEVAKKSPKVRKTDTKSSKKGKGKGKVAPQILVPDSSDEMAEGPSGEMAERANGNETVHSTMVRDSPTTIQQTDGHTYHSGRLVFRVPNYVSVC
jgi:hypothetical protein